MKKKLLFVIKNFEEILCCSALLVTVCAVLFNIVSGILFRRRFGQCEEIAIAAFVWITFIGISVAYKHKAHICIDFVMEALPRRAREILEPIILLVMIAFNVVVVYYAAGMTLHAANKTMPLSGLPYFYINGSVVIGFFFMTVYAIRDFANIIRRRAAK